MKPAPSRFDQAFLHRQRERLLELRAELIRATRSREAEERDINAQSQDEAHEYEEDAQKLAMLEVDQNLVAHDLRRLAQVQRALAKLDDGTYGMSDSSGRPISKERLEAVPEATDAVDG